MDDGTIKYFTSASWLENYYKCRF